MRHFLLWTSSWWLLTACIERIPLDESLAGQPLLVVDGEMSNLNEPYRVQLSYTSPTLRAYEGEELTGARVYVTDERGGRADLAETEAGTYETDSTTFWGRVGQTYQLHVEAPDGRSYVSLPETMPQTAPIDTVYFELESRSRLIESEGETLLTTWGLQFYLDGGTGASPAGYYRWTYSETYQFTSPLGGPLCYLTTFPTRLISVASTQDLARDQVVKQPINFVDITGRKLQKRYSLLVRQASLTERAYRFWQNVVEQQENVGSVFDPPPAPIAGNMRNVNDDGEVVLGYFQVAAVTRKRIFVSRFDVPERTGLRPDGFPDCSSPNGGEVPDYCADCRRLTGATTIPPSFW